ncbi:MAG: DUF5123 domain-containing protein [Bacteroidales bacterium]|jgi:hypothetical protein|nr:DUF5123 domain-containing protein [Bacteroidales bacterium]
MKKINIISGLIPVLFSLLLINACKEEIDPIVEQLDFDRAFTPVGLTAAVSDVTKVTLGWSSVKNADHYTLEICEGTDFTPASLVKSVEVPVSDDVVVVYSYVLPAGDTQFSARVKAVSALTGVDESKWTVVEFRTAPEDLFTGYRSEMTGLNSCIVRWKPGVVATDLAFDNGTSETLYPITAGELAAGAKTLTGVPNASYEVKLMNTTFSRGSINLLIEGDILLAPGGDLNAALDATPSGGVLILTNGTKYGLTEPDTVTSSIKIRGLYPDNLPTIYLMTGAPIAYHMFDIGTAMTASDSLVFENVDISCYYDDAGVTKHRGVIDQEASAFIIGAIKFNNCIIRNSGRSAIRLRGNAAGQVINNVEFNNCIMYDFAFDSHYGVLNGATTGNFINIRFRNSTVYNIRGGIINYGSGAGCQSVVVDNCTFNAVTMDAASARYFIDFGTTGNLSNGTLQISDCIFGQTSAIANGVRNNLMVLSVTGSYYTSDFVNVSGSIIPSMTSYAGASTSLWSNPVGGVFTFADPNFAGAATAGDPRWKP